MAVAGRFGSSNDVAVAIVIPSVDANTNDGGVFVAP